MNLLERTWVGTGLPTAGVPEMLTDPVDSLLFLDNPRGLREVWLPWRPGPGQHVPFLCPET